MRGACARSKDLNGIKPKYNVVVSIFFSLSLYNPNISDFPDFPEAGHFRYIPQARGPKP